MSLFWGSAAQGQTRWLSSMAQPDIRIIASPSSHQTSEQRHCSSLKLSHMRLLRQSSRGALGSPQDNVPQEGKATGEAQAARHWCFVTEAASPTQGAADLLIHQAGIPGTQQQGLLGTMLKAWWGEVGHADSEKGRLRRNPEIKLH